MSEAQHKITALENLAKSGALTLQSVVDSLKTTFGMDELFTLAKHNHFMALNYFELIADINYVLLTNEPSFKVWNTVYQNTVEDKLSAIGMCFYVQAAKCDGMINTLEDKAFMSVASDVATIAGDAINGFIGASRDIINLSNAVKK